MQRQDRRRFLKTVGATGALLTTGTAAATPGEGKREGASGDDTLFDIVEGSDDFDTLELALETTGLDAVLDGDDGQYTVFAPTDEAFGDLLDALNATPEELLARDDLADILLYHVTNGRRYASSIVNAPQVQTLFGEAVTVETTEGAVVLNDGQANITGTNNEANNGVAHFIDGVLLP